jgi:4-hydroxy-4-methyl-2-oxoglutarate aldolase
MKAPRIEKKIIEGFHALATPNVADALDRHGINGMPRGLMPLYPSCGKLVGPAATMKLLPLGSPTSASTSSPVLGTLEAIVAGRPGDVLVIDFGGNTEVNSMGGVAGATAKHHGLVGCVSDGVARDIEEYRDLDFPMYGKGYITTSIRNRCVFGGHSIDVELSGVPVRPGDLIMADWSGAVVVPQERVTEILKLATELKRIEDSVIAAVRRGEDPVQAHENVRYDAMTSVAA